jgi:RNA polymerase sigma factor (sigma-70 family)
VWRGIARSGVTVVNLNAGAGDGNRSGVVNATEDDPTGRVHLSDPVLIQSCLAGDESAWEELVDRYGRLVYAIPKRMGLSDSDAQDVFQDVFLTLLRHLGDVRDHTRLSAWLITTTRREALRYGRVGGRRVESVLEEAIVDDAPPPVDDVVRWEREQAVRQAIRRLDARCRELLTMLFLEPVTTRYETIATRLGMPVGSIGPTRARCFKKLDAILRQMGIDDSA